MHWLFFLGALIAGTAAWAQDRLTLYIDADFSISAAAGNAIELGVRTALAATGNEIGGVPVDVVAHDHRANSKRSYRTLATAAKDPQALVVFGGMHSPPYLTYRDFINENRILTLLPWSAAGPITRAPQGLENWLFRLSVDDSKAGRFLIDQALNVRGCERIALLLLDTGWGRANRSAMETVLAESGAAPVHVAMFPTGLGEAAASHIVAEVTKAQADCVVMLAQASEGAFFANGFAKSGKPIKLLSHWAILGGRFTQLVSHETRQLLGLSVLQTCGLRAEQEGRPQITAALSQSEPPLGALADIPAPTGFVHGYDLALLLIAAAKQAAATPAWAGPIGQKRLALKSALEALEHPVEGMLRRYDRPFSRYSPQAPDAHEALGASDLCMAGFRPDGRLRDIEM